MVHRYNHRTATCSWCMLQGDPVATIPKLVKDIGAGALVTDLAVLRLGREWRTKASTHPEHDAASLCCHSASTGSEFLDRQQAPAERFFACTINAGL